MGILNSYQDEYEEFYDRLVDDWEMKPRYAMAFLTAYKRKLGKKLNRGRRKASQLLKNPNPEIDKTLGPLGSTIAALNLEDPDLLLVSQAYEGYMTDLRRRKFVGTDVEKAIWAILSNRSDLFEDHDPQFASYVASNQERVFPNLYKEVFADTESQREHKSDH